MIGKDEMNPEEARKVLRMILVLGFIVLTAYCIATSAELERCIKAAEVSAKTIENITAVSDRDISEAQLEVGHLNETIRLLKRHIERNKGTISHNDSLPQTFSSFK